jgi:AcrR family transcriptional regulator
MKPRRKKPTPSLTKGEQTRRTILDHASRLASRVGLEGLSIGRLANDLDLSKSGLFAHFRSKEVLCVQVLEAAAARFVDEVIKPALATPRGEPRMRALFEGWLSWAKSNSMPGGCLFVAASVELDDRPGPVRDRLVALQRDWLEVIANVARSGKTEKHFRADLDPEQLAHDLYSVMLGYHHASRLLADPRAGERAHAGFESILSAARRRGKAA